MADVKSMHDLRTMRSITHRGIPSNESQVFLHLHRLSSEKLRLEREVELWQQKKERIGKRLEEIELQMDELRGTRRGTVAQPDTRFKKNACRQVTLEY